MSFREKNRSLLKESYVLNM